MYNAKNKRENCQKEEILDRKRAQSWNASKYKNILDRMTDKTTRQETYRDRGDNQFIFVNTFVRNICVQLLNLLTMQRNLKQQTLLLKKT
jgi:hypothetical protein